MSIYTGTDAIINRFLFANTANQYQQSTALRILSGRRTFCPDAAALVRELYECMEETWLGSTRRLSTQPSKKNWRFTQEPSIDEKNTSREKQVEKRIAYLALEGKLDANQWANQVPVASGLLGVHTDKKACVDIAFRQGTHSFDLLELGKFSSCRLETRGTDEVIVRQRLIIICKLALLFLEGRFSFGGMNGGGNVDRSVKSTFHA